MDLNQLILEFPVFRVPQLNSDRRDVNSFRFEAFCLICQVNDMSEDGTTTAVAEPIVSKVTEKKRDPKRKKQPRYNVILWDDNDHSYEYVINMMRQIFGYPYAKGVQLAKMVDSLGRCICLTTTKEHAELKRDQILSYGKDILIERCRGSMTATIEAIE